MNKSLLKLRLSANFALGRPKPPIAASIDITHRCNLNCRHCYFKKAGYSKELSDRQWTRRIKNLVRRHNLYHCSWIGGEPLLRKDLIEKTKNFFGSNWVITNGNFEIPKWKHCVFFVSIDGTRRYHERIRGKGTYNKTKMNVLNSRSKTFIGTVLNSINYNSVEPLIKEWYGTNVEGINFDFYTPKTLRDRYTIPFDKRDTILDKISKLKKKYPGFILLTNKMISYMKSENQGRVVGDKCLVGKYVISLDPTGKIKRPCVMGEMNCNICGCVVPYFIKSCLDKDIESLRLAIKVLS